MRDPRSIAWEKTLDRLLDEIDQRLEAEYGEQARLHPARPQTGTTADPAMDGLFRVEAHFTPGYGSALGRGYILRVQMATLESISPDLREEIEARAAHLLRERLPQAFPHRHLQVERDGPLYKIHGDLRLGD